MTTLERALIGALFLLANAVLLLWIQPAAAQDSGNDVLELQTELVETENYPAIDLVVRTPSEFGGAPDGAISFDVSANGEPVPDATITQITAENLEVVLMIDTSGSMAGEPLAAAKAASLTFLEGLPASAKIAVVGFGSAPEVAVEFSEDRSIVAESIEGLTARGETAVYDAVVESVALFAETEDTQQFIVLLTDGGDTVSSASLSAALNSVGLGGVPVVAVSLTTDESDPEALQLLAGAANGEFVEAENTAAVQAVFDQVASSISTSYSIAFETEAEGTTELEVVATWNNLVARTSFNVNLPVVTVPATTTAPTPSTTTVAPTTTAALAQSAAPATITIEAEQPAWLLVLGALSMALAMLIAFTYLFWPRQKRRRRPLLFGEGAPTPSSVGNALSSSASRLTNVVGAVLERDRDQSRIALRLAQAGIDMRPAEAVTVLLLGMIASFLIGVLIAAALAFLLPVLFAGAAIAFIAIKASIRKRAFQTQLPSTLQMMAGSLRSGYSLLQVADVIAREALPPTSDEFARVVVENRLGRDLTESFEDMADRVDSEDFPWVVDAIDISRSIGGDLAEVLDTVAKTVRDREEVRREIKTLSAEGRMSAGVMTSLPFVMLGMLTIVNPDYLSELFTTATGRMFGLLGIFLLLTGAFWMRRIVRLEY